MQYQQQIQGGQNIRLLQLAQLLQRQDIQMFKDRMIQLTQLTPKKQRVGSKLTLPVKPLEIQSSFIEIQNLIKIFANNNQQISQLRTEYRKTAKPATQREISGKVGKVTKKNQKLLTTINQKIKEINEEQKKKFQAGNKQDTLRVAKINQQANEAIKEFRDLQEKFTNNMKGNIRRQAIILQGDISEDEVENIMQHPEQGQQMLREKLLDHPSVQLENAVSDIMDKYRDIIQLEKNMNQCLQMMQEMALLVAMTGQQLDSIQQNILQAQDFTVQADAKLIQAKKHHKSAKKKKCCIIMLLLAVIGAILIPVLITQL